MLNSRTRLDHMHNQQELIGLHEKCHKLRDFLSKPKKQKKAIEDYKNYYDPTMETLQQEKQCLHEAVGRYIVKRNYFKKQIKSLEVDLANGQQKLDDFEPCYRYSECLTGKSIDR